MQKIVEPRPEQSKNWDTTGNLLIKGDNLDALRLLRHSYFGKVKLIYIDPPYNTQSDAFIYRDDFSAKQSEVLAQLGYAADNIDYIKNIYGARTHSGWLSFMYPRLLLAKDLLRDDGVIFISIDDNEQAQLKLLCDEVFGQENFVSELIWQKKTGAGAKSKGFIGLHEYVLCYAKNVSANWDVIAPLTDKTRAMYTKRDEHFESLGPFATWPLDTTSMDERANLRYAIHHEGHEIWPKKQWLWSKERVLGAQRENKLVFNYNVKNASWNIRFKGYLFDADGDEKSGKPTSVLIGPYTQEGTKDFEAYFERELFPFPKPVELIRKLIGISVEGTDAGVDDIYLDFFAGSGTTAEAVMRLNAEDGGNRQFILVQIPQPIDAKKQKEAHQFVTDTLQKPDATIFEITAERLRRAGAKIEAELAAKALAEAAKPAQLEGFAPTTDAKPTPIDTGFRVFELVNDPEALILSKPLQHATQADVLALQTAIATPQPAQLPRVLHNLLLSESLPLTTVLRTVKDQCLYLAGDVLMVVHAVALDELTDTLRALQAQGTPATYLTVYAPWIADDNFMLGIKTVAESLGYS
ncbi:MAG: site-specific DNA-methyltransferase, partial [Rhodoferax sp.]|nr:site-specific DNA-methyltransferase [Rhodoferax sp.]